MFTTTGADELLGGALELGAAVVLVGLGVFVGVLVRVGVGVAVVRVGVALDSVGVGLGLGLVLVATRSVPCRFSEIVTTSTTASAITTAAVSSIHPRLAMAGSDPSLAREPSR